MTYTFDTTAEQDQALEAAAPQQGQASAADMFTIAVNSTLSSLVATNKQQLLNQLQSLPAATLASIVAANVNA